VAKRQPKKKTRRPSTSSAPNRKKSPADPVTAYAHSVAEGRIVAGPQVRDACARHLRDLVDGHERGLVWDAESALRAINYFPDVLRLNGGEFEGLPFHLLDWQQFIVGSLFGWMGGDGYRRYRMAYIESGKGSGKSPLAAGLGLYMQTADDESRAEVYAAATKKDQAMVLFRDAVAMVDQSPALSRMMTKSGGNPVWQLTFESAAAFFKPISSDDAQSGPRPHCGLLDEVHEHKDARMVDMMRAGTKGRRQALVLMITNSGDNRTSTCFHYHEYARKVASGAVLDDSFFGYVCALDEGEDPLKSESCWPKANPSLGVTFQLKYLRELGQQAKGMPSKEAVVRRLNFCQWTDAHSPWIAQDIWDAAQGEVLPDQMAEFPCYLGVDLSRKNDLTALAAVWRVDDRYAARLWFWTPGERIDEHEKTDRAPYRVWVNHGHIIAPDGPEIDYEDVADVIGTLLITQDVQGAAFDPWRFKEMNAVLTRRDITTWKWDGPESFGNGLPLYEHGQGSYGGGSEKKLWMPRSLDNLESVLIRRAITIHANPCLTWNAASAVTERDKAGNRSWTKAKATGRIDGIVALSMAVGLSEHLRIETPVSNDWNLVVL
jgi:phage terminase large subunit-like protein